MSGALAWVFPGQGAQRRGMGAELFDRFPRECAAADEVLGYPVAQLCRHDEGERLRRTEFAQPALFVVNALSYLDAVAAGGRSPDYLAGHSLGEYNALFAAGCFDFVTGVRLVAERGRLMAQAAGGGMAAVVGLAPERVESVLAEHGGGELDIANYNSPRQIVLSGTNEDLGRCAEAIRAAGGRFVPLPVNAAFHSRRMRGVAARFEEFLTRQQFAAPRVPVLANVTARPHTATTTAELLGAQVAGPVRWTETMRWLLDHDVTELVEIGPGRVLTGLWTAMRESVAGPPATRVRTPDSGPERLGSRQFRRDYGIRYAYLAGSMFRGIASTDLVVRLGEAGLLGFFGAGGLELDEIDRAIRDIRARLGPDGRYGMNLLHSFDQPELEQELVGLYLRHDVRFVEAAGFTQVTPALVRFRFSGAHRDADGTPVARRHVVAKVSRPEVATQFLCPPTDTVLAALRDAGWLTAAETEVARELPVSGDLCVEADSGGHTDARAALTLVPAMLRLRDEQTADRNYPAPVRVGAAGGIGSPEAVAAAFLLGADFVLTGSVNQCSPQAATSDVVKDALAGLDVQDTTYAPAGDMFEVGARVQVVRKGSLFAARANKLYQVYRQYPSLDAIEEPLRRTIEDTYFHRSFEEVWLEVKRYFTERGRTGELDRADRQAKHRMVLIFRWYFARSIRAAIAGEPDERVNYQIHCGHSMGAFNRFVRGTRLQDWRNRHVDVIADALMSEAASCWERAWQRTRGADEKEDQWDDR